MLVLLKKSSRGNFLNTYTFSYHGNNKFTLFFQKGVYPFEYMNDQKKFNEASLPGKDDFYNHLNGRRLCAPKKILQRF